MPRRSWAAYWDFFTALSNNVPIWINKIRHRGLNMLAAHGDALMGAEGKNMKARLERGEKMLTNREAWNDLDTPAKLKWLRHLNVTGSQAQKLSEPKITSWNAGPHGFENSRDEIFNLFAQSDPVICLQDLRIPKK